jgi:3-oxoacyl-[acyl-carrier protein] reductase
LNFCA